MKQNVSIPDSLYLTASLLSGKEKSALIQHVMQEYVSLHFSEITTSMFITLGEEVVRRNLNEGEE